MIPEMLTAIAAFITSLAALITALRRPAGTPREPPRPSSRGGVRAHGR
jgi:hypothetical protein